MNTYQFNEFNFLAFTQGSPDIQVNIKRVFCQTSKQAFEKAKFLYPNQYFLIKIVKGKGFKSLRELDNYIRTVKASN